MELPLQHVLISPVKSGALPMRWLFVSRLPCPCCTHTHILALSAKEFGNRYCNCVVSELVIDQLGVGLAYRSAGWQVQGRSAGRHAHTHIPQRAPSVPSQERRVSQGSAGLELLPYKVLPYSGIVSR